MPRPKLVPNVDSYQGVKVFVTKDVKPSKKNPDAPTEKLKRLGKIHMAVFNPDGTQLVGFLVARPDVVGMVQREDAFLAWDSFKPCERGLVVSRPDDGLDDAARKRLGVDWDACVMFAGMDAKTVSGKVLGYVNDVSFDLETGAVEKYFVGDGGISRAIVGSFEIPTSMVRGYSAGYMIVDDEAAKLQLDGGAAAKAGEAWAAAKAKGSEAGRAAGKAAGEAVDKGSYQLGRMLGKAKRALDEAMAEEPEPADPAELPAVDVTVSEPVETLRASAEDRGDAEPVTYVPVSEKPEAKPAQAVKPASTASAEAKKAAVKKKAASAGDQAARALGRGLGSMGKMFGSFKEEFDKASK